MRDSIEEASVSLGVPPLRSFFKVVLPLIGPGGRLALASAYSVILMIAIFLPLAIARWTFKVRVDAI